MDITTPAGRVIRQLRQEKGCTQQQLADKVGLERVPLAERELGRTKVTIPELRLFSEAFGISVDQLKQMIESEAGEAEPSGIPVLNRGAAGLVIDYEQHNGALEGSTEYLERDARTNIDGLFALVVVGSSMSPALDDGDRAIFSPVPGRYEPKPGESLVYVRMKDGRNIVGQFNRKGTGLEIKKTGKGGKPVVLKPEDVAQMAVLIQIRRDCA